MIIKANVKLRAVEPTDADFMYEVENDPDAWKYTDTVAPLSRKILRDYALNYDADPFSSRQLRMIITDSTLGSPRPVGIADLYEIEPIHRRAFIGIYILPSFRHRGIGKEALRLLMDYAFRNLRLRKLFTKIESTNFVSKRLFLKSDFRLDGKLDKWFDRKEEGFTDLWIMTKEDCEAN